MTLDQALTQIGTQVHTSIHYFVMDSGYSEEKALVLFERLVFRAAKDGLCQQKTPYATTQMFNEFIAPYREQILAAKAKRG